MTAKEKWKNAILGELKSRNIRELLEKHITLPCILLSSVERKEDIVEVIVCPYCFEETKIEYSKLKKHTVKRTCSHCQREFANACVKTGESSKAYFKGDRIYYNNNMILTAANICGEDGILYVELAGINVKYNLVKKRVIIRPNITGYGFAFVGGRYRYMYGKASGARTANYNSYSHPDFFADDSVLEFAKKKQITDEYALNERDIMRLMYDLENTEKKKPNPGRSVFALKAARLIKENPIDELPIDIFNKHEYLNIEFRKVDKLTDRYYYKGYCDSCGSSYSFNKIGRMYAENRTHKCPRCGKGTVLFVDGYSCNRQYTVVDVVGDSGIAVRNFTCCYEYKKRNVEIEAKEKSRIYINYSKNPEWRFMYMEQENDNVWKVRKTDNIPHCYLKEDNLIVTERAEDFLRYTGFREYIDIYLNNKETPYYNLTLKMLFYFLNASAMASCLEKIAKLGWNRLCAYYAENITKEYEIGIEQNGRTVCEVLKLPKRLVNYIAERGNNNPGSDNVAGIQRFYAIDENVMPEDLDWCATHGIDARELKRIIELIDISVHQAVEYLERVRVSQCFLPKSAVIEWYDYLNASQNIQADLSDKTVRYPSSLKREHDRAAFKYQVIKDKTKEERFQKICREYGETYFYESEEFQIVAPVDMQDLFEEGRRLNHCVGNYADRIADGKTCICFIRKKSEPDRPYFTVEIAPEEERVRQIHGLSNRNVDRTRDHELFQFLKKWARAKRICISAM